jgi:beta-lactamase class D
MRFLIILICLFWHDVASGQPDMVTPFRDCHLQGSCTVYDYNQKKWLMSDSIDAEAASLPASTFKIVNLLIALETGVIHDENEVVRWSGVTDTVKYGYRPEIYKDMTVREAFQVSSVWVFLELAQRIGRDKYQHYLNLCGYGNADLSEKDPDFWNFGALAISPRNQVQFLVRLYEGTLPFSKRNMEILKRVMITEQNDNFVIHSKTGWTREKGIDSGWWVGYVERKDNSWFFATRVSKKRSTVNPDFSNCRKEITRNILKQLKVIE